jgi:hypothetical protein
MPSFNAKHRGQRTAGFSLIALLIVIAILGMTSAASLQIGALLQRRGAEDELLQDLLKDPRYPNPRRHLRKHYADPISGTDEWGAIESPGASGITGIYSRAEGQPTKRPGSRRAWSFSRGAQRIANGYSRIRRRRQRSARWPIHFIHPPASLSSCPEYSGRSGKCRDQNSYSIWVLTVLLCLVSPASTNNAAL